MMMLASGARVKAPSPRSACPREPGGGTDLISATPITDTNWHHFAFTFDGSHGLKLYQDGVLVGSAVTESPWAATNTTFELGTSEHISGLNGLLHQIRLSAGVRTSFPEGAFAAITKEPLSAAGGPEQ